MSWTNSFTEDEQNKNNYQINIYEIINQNEGYKVIKKEQDKFNTDEPDQEIDITSETDVNLKKCLDNISSKFDDFLSKKSETKNYILITLDQDNNILEVKIKIGDDEPRKIELEDDTKELFKEFFNAIEKKLEEQLKNSNSSITPENVKTINHKKLPTISGVNHNSNPYVV